MFIDAGHQAKVIFDKVFYSNSHPEDDITEKWKVRMVELIFHVVSRNVFDAATWKS